MFSFLFTRTSKPGPRVGQYTVDVKSFEHIALQALELPVSDFCTLANLFNTSGMYSKCHLFQVLFSQN